VELTREQRDEVEGLARRYGQPRRLRVAIDDRFDDPIRKGDRFGEICMVIRRPSGKVLLSIKTFYPRGAYRLPTGGIHHGELIGDAVTREAHEETGLDIDVRRFLAHIAYLGPSGGPPLFHTFAFLLAERGGTLGALDESEQIESWREVEVDELPRIANALANLTAAGSRDIGGSWTAWGKFRSVVHGVVYEALTSPGGRT